MVYMHNLFLPYVQVIDRSFGFDTAVEEAQRAINAAHVEAGSAENGIGLVKLMGRHSGMFLGHSDMSCWNETLLAHHILRSIQHNSFYANIFILKRPF